MTRMVAQRTTDIGLRMALGAPARAVLGMVLGSAMRVVAVGLALGLAGASGLSRLLGAVLPSMATDTGVVSAAAVGLLTGVALVACYLPARRAAGVDPIGALRGD
jgi:putative ABC transport system permease protein